jgi:DNA polymerase III delta prime subunit
MFFIDKYIPKNEDEFVFHKDIYNILKIMSEDDSIPHVIFHGSSGTGKKTMVHLFMKMLFGDSILNHKNLAYNVSGSGNTTTVEEFEQSFHHIFIEPKGNNHDRYLIHDVIKLYIGKTRCNLFKTKHKFKLVIINNIDIMSESVQFSLRRTIEQYSEYCRFILISNSISKIIKPLTSRCKCIAVKAPSIEDIVTYSFDIGKKENINITLNRLSYIITKYNGNIKNVLWVLQTFKTNDIYIENIKNNFVQINLLLQKLNINIDFDNYIEQICNENINNTFIIKNIDKFINNIAVNIYDDIFIKSKFVTKYINQKDIGKYFTEAKDFLNKINKTTIKKITFNTQHITDKKIKLDNIVIKIKILLFESLYMIKLLDPRLTIDIYLKSLYKYIKCGELKNMYVIRDIIFNLLITNITGTDIIKSLLQHLIVDPKLNPQKKLKIFEVCKDTEYGIIKGRREINQFDNLVISIINIIYS